MTTLQKADDLVKLAADNVYVKAGTVVTIVTGLITLIWLVADFRLSYMLDKQRNENLYLELSKQIEFVRYDRWTRLAQERWVNDLEKQNPSLKTPDPSNPKYNTVTK